ncbi:hypothetical protein MMC07_008564 [Pseudocyphellaria aurata]|nr:hypothetical protein [Pseudocyphellaria aurata]
MPRSSFASDTVPTSFLAKKQTILGALATPSNSYTDRSPKGSVDDGIKDLIDRINRLEGIVTTSSCAGRISVFLQGRNKASPGGDGDEEEEGVQDGFERGGGKNDDDGGVGGPKQQLTTPGGKGRGGKWLFVSHEPVQVPSKQVLGDTPLCTLFGLSNVPRSPGKLNTRQMRFVRFQFEPMILHIMAASLHHAQEILSAAITAGFRESGVQSLKNLEDPNSFPMVAVRTSGVALSSLIGYMHDGENEEEIQSIVDEEYLEILLSVANERFVQNSERIQRFSDNLFRRANEVWEDKSVRQARKRAEGLEQQQILRENKEGKHETYSMTVTCVGLTKNENRV